MAKNDDIQRKIDLLEQSKYDLGQERRKGFMEAAMPALVTFGAIGAVAGIAVALFTSAGIGAIAGVGLISGLTAGAATGGVAAMRSGRDAKDKNNAIEEMELRLKQEALSQGVDVTLPEQQPQKAPQIDLSPDAQNRPKFLNDIIERGQKTFDPREIAGRAVNDARETFRR